MKSNKISFKFLLKQGSTFALTLLIVITMVLAQPATTALAAKSVGYKAPGAQASPPTMLNGTLNTYYPGTADAPAGTTLISVGAARAGGGPPIAAGDMLLVVQMQGADLDGNNDERYGDGVGIANTAGDTVEYSAANAYAGGNLAVNFSAGQYEYVTATGPVSGGTVPISTGLVSSYFSAPFSIQGQRTFQVIRVPQYLNANLSGTVSALRWDGSTGGIVVFSVQDTLDWNGNTIDVSSLGFRGGGGRQLGGLGDPVGAFASTDYRTLSTFTVNGSKGEGYAGSPRYINDNGSLLDNGVANEGFVNGSYGRGASGNGGGGSTDGNPRSNSRNSGGGGGNGGYGGMGGNSWLSGAVTGGFGGAPFPGSAPRVILGGGGGAGTTNDGTGSPVNGFASSGAAGGGVVMVRACTIVGTGTIRADGASANQTVLNDGGGGGGAGGSVVIIARNNSGSVGNLTVSAVGGGGGSTWSLRTAPIDRHGPGGGGGGGFIFTSGSLVAGDVSGGLNGTSTTANDPFGATPGGDGVAFTRVPPTCVPPPTPPGGGRNPPEPRDTKESSGGAFFIPVTGFAPNTVTELSAASLPAHDETNLRIEIPVLKVNTSIVGVQQKKDSWDVSWLLNEVGWLNGTAYPTWAGNSLLTGHVVDSNGNPGIFFNLKDLGVGEYIFIYHRGNRYTYKVESNKLVEASDKTVMKHEEKSYLTLITCDTYDEKTGAYLKRVAVRAVLVDVREAK